MFKESKVLPFWLFTITTIVILVVSQLIQDGIFMDGLLYISIGKNLADGLGTFWDPHFSQTNMNSFHEQPPLYFGLLALFYKILGTSMYVERLFCFVCFSVTALYIYKIWKKIFTTNNNIANNAWLPILFWTSIPVCFWAYTNHVEETVMAVFSTISIYYIYCALFLHEKTIRNLVIAGIFIFLSSLTKGFQGVFPIIAVGFYWLVIRKISFKEMFFYSLVLVGIPTVIYLFLLFTNNEVYSSFETYFGRRLVGTFNNIGATTSNRFELLIRLFMELLPIMGVSSLFLLFTKKYRAQDYSSKLHYPTIIWFVLIGLSGSLPLMVTLEQRGFYLVTSFPFFAIAIAMLLGPRLTTFTNKINVSALGFKLFKISTIILLLIAIIFSITKIGAAKRDKDLLSDIYTIGKIVPHGEIISVPSEMGNEWSLIEYFIRYFYISSDSSNNQHKYFVIRKELPRTLIPKGYKQCIMETKEIDLFVLTN